jgi:hypothetical protein
LTMSLSRRLENGNRTSRKRASRRFDGKPQGVGSFHLPLGRLNGKGCPPLFLCGTFFKIALSVLSLASEESVSFGPGNTPSPRAHCAAIPPPPQSAASVLSAVTALFASNRLVQYCTSAPALRQRFQPLHSSSLPLSRRWAFWRSGAQSTDFVVRKDVNRTAAGYFVATPTKIFLPIELYEQENQLQGGGP